MTIWVVISEFKQDQFTDRHGETAMPTREIEGVFANYEDAEYCKNVELIRESGIDDDVNIVIERWEVE